MNENNLTVLAGFLCDGAVFSAANIDDKWDIFLHDGYLYFAHSWAGELHFRATIQFVGDELVVTGIDADSNVTGGDVEGGGSGRIGEDGRDLRKE